MQLQWKNCFRAGVSLFLLYLLIHYWDGIVGFVGSAYKALWPLILGGIMAYAVNILMNFMEIKYRAFQDNRRSRHGKPLAKGSGDRELTKETDGASGEGADVPETELAAPQKPGRFLRPLAMIGSYLLIFLAMAFVLVLVIPELIGAVNVLVAGFPDAMERVFNSRLADRYLPEVADYLGSLDWESIVNDMLNLLKKNASMIANGTFSVFAAVTSNIVNLVLGFIFSLYLLLGKERIQGQVTAVARRFLPESIRRPGLRILRIINGNFHSFIVGQCTEAVIIGVLCAAGMFLFRFPYAAMVGVLVGATALVPVAGAYIGAGVGAFLILTVSPLKALLFLVFIVVLQQLEGNLIYPRVVGSSIGLPAIWVLTAVTLGGGLGGIPGMLFGVPLFASVYQLLKEETS